MTSRLAHPVEPSGTGILREDRADRAAQRIASLGRPPRRDRRLPCCG
jgi:hypothetical protein